MVIRKTPTTLKARGPMATRNAVGPDNSLRRSFLLAALGVSIGLLLLAGGFASWQALPELPVRDVSFRGTMRYTAAADLARVAQQVGGDLWRVDLEGLRAEVKRLPWVRDATVRRVFPDHIEIILEEHVPVAYWQERDRRGLLNSRGEVFSAEYQQPLPVWSGPPGGAAEVMAEYARFSAILAAINLKPAEVRLSARRAWQVKLDNGSVLELGRVDTDMRLQRFVRAQSQLPELRTAGLHADLRYGNGLVLRKALQSLSPKSPAVNSEKGK
jgi:cell division protein FtsQ